MPESRIKVLFINGIRNSGKVDVVQATATGRLVFSTGGSCHVSSFLPAEQVAASHFALDHHRRQTLDSRFILEHDLVFCELSDPDTYSVALSKARALYDQLQGRIGWLNNPHRIVDTSRDRVPARLAGIDGLTIPATIRVSPGTAEDLQQAIEAGGLSLPVLLRPAGSHGGQGLVLVERWQDLQQLALGRYRDAFVTEFVDTSRDGVFAKYRLAVIDGEPLLRHVIFSDHWVVHSESRSFMAANPRFRELEEQALKDFERELKPRLAPIMTPLVERVGLDYFGIDCAIDGNRLVLFELNATMNILNNNQPLPNPWQEPIRQMQERIMQRLIVPHAGAGLES